MPSWKVTRSASLVNKTSIFGIMGGLYNRKISGRSSMNRVTSRLEIPASAKEGYQYMKMHNILSKNPLGSGGVGRMFHLRAGGSRRTSSYNSQNNLGSHDTNCSSCLTTLADSSDAVITVIEKSGGTYLDFSANLQSNGAWDGVGVGNNWQIQALGEYIVMIHHPPTGGSTEYYYSCGGKITSGDGGVGYLTCESTSGPYKLTYKGGGQVMDELTFDIYVF
jgi:hypothetical protein